MTRSHDTSPEIGVGLRTHYFKDIFSEASRRLPPTFWFEALSENFMGIQGMTGGLPLARLLKLRKDFPVALHGVSLSIASIDPIDQRYLNALKNLVDICEPFLVSDHLCFTGVDHHNVHDLLPFPLTEESLELVSEKILRVQDFLKRPLMIENVSSYLTFHGNTLSEWDFLGALVRKTSCQILLDINNVFVSATNHHWDPKTYLDALPHSAIQQYHLAGFTDCGNYLFDTHDHAVSKEVWDLYRYALQTIGKCPTLLEWDDHFPPWEKLLMEAQKAHLLWKPLHEKHLAS